jgi:hypothetical protein
MGCNIKEIFDSAVFSHLLFPLIPSINGFHKKLKETGSSVEDPSEILTHPPNKDMVEFGTLKKPVDSHWFQA